MVKFVTAICIYLISSSLVCTGMQLIAVNRRFSFFKEKNRKAISQAVPT